VQKDNYLAWKLLFHWKASQWIRGLPRENSRAALHREHSGYLRGATAYGVATQHGMKHAGQRAPWDRHMEPLSPRNATRKAPSRGAPALHYRGMAVFDHPKRVIAMLRDVLHPPVSATPCPGLPGNEAWTLYGRFS